MPRGFSFFVRSGHSGKIRGGQIAEFIGGKWRVSSGYENDICIWVKTRPPVPYPKHTYVDIMDEPWCLPWVKRHPDVGVIACSKYGQEYLMKELGRKDIVLIPEHHANYERVRIPKREIKRVGVMGGMNSFQFPYDEAQKMFKDIGLEFVIETKYQNRYDVINFYKDIDIQVVYRPYNPKPELCNPLKIINAGSMGIPSVAYPEPSYVSDCGGAFIEARKMEEFVAHVKMLKEDRMYYDEWANKALAKSEEFHIEKMAKLYLALSKDDAETTGGINIDFKVSASLLDKNVMVDGELKNVYGLAHFRANPRNKGIGREAVRGMEKVAEKDGKLGIVAFCAPGLIPFYRKCGWYEYGNFQKRLVVSNIKCKTIEVTERW